MTEPFKRLVVGPSWVGDMVLAQALYRRLAERGSAVIDVVAPPWSLPILERMPEVRRGIELPVGHGEFALGRRYRLGRSLRAERYDQAIILPRSWKSALVPYFAKVPLRTGFRGESRHGLLNDIRPLDRAVLDQTVKRFVVLGGNADEPLPAEWPVPRLEARPEAFAKIEARLGLAGGGPALAIMPGAEYGPAKQWPIDRYANIALRLAESGCRIWVLGSAKERGLGDRIAAADARGRIRNLCGETSLAEAIDVLAASRVAITNDSGLMHVAAAVGTHVVAIFGSSSPAYTPPLTPACTVLYLGIECSPCFQRTCPLGHLRCLREIDETAVLDATLAVLGEGRHSQAARKESVPPPERYR